MLFFYVLIGFTQQYDKLVFRLSHWRGSALGFPRGEAVAKIGASEPILVTDEEWRNLPITGAVRKKSTISEHGLSS